MRPLVKSLSVIALMPLFLLVASCGGGGGGGGAGNASSVADNVEPSPGTGKIALLATDAPTDEYQAINLTIVSAELLSDSGSVTVFEGEKTFDLLQLTQVTEIFSVTEVPEGTYSTIRLSVAEIELVFHDEREPLYPALPGNGTLDLVPSEPITIAADQTLVVQLDFDAEKSILMGDPNSDGAQANFRLVVFVDIIDDAFDTKLIRQRGTINRIDLAQGTFKLCLISTEAEPVAEGELPDCILVDTGKAPASLFDDFANLIGLDGYALGDIVTVVGRFSFDSEDQGVSGFSSDGGEDNNPKNRYDDSNRDFREEDVNAIRVLNDDDDDDDDDFGDDDDDSGDDDDDSGDDDDDSGDDDDDSGDDDDDFGDDDDDFGDDDDDSDDDPNDDPDDRDIVLVADVVWRGSEIEQSQNVACSGVSNDTERGNFYDNFELTVPAGETCAEDGTGPTVLQPGAKIFDVEGREAPISSITEGTLNKIDAYTNSAASPEEQKAVLVLLGPTEEQDEEIQWVGTIGDIDPGVSLILITNEGDRCVNFSEADTKAFIVDEQRQGNTVFEPRDLSELMTGQRILTTGLQDAQGCLNADVIIFEEEGPAT